MRRTRHADHRSVGSGAASAQDHAAGADMDAACTIVHARRQQHGTPEAFDQRQPRHPVKGVLYRVRVVTGQGTDPGLYFRIGKSGATTAVTGVRKVHDAVALVRVFISQASLRIAIYPGTVVRRSNGGRSFLCLR